MAKKYVNKAVYDALWGIADEKRGYETKKSSGTDGYQTHQANAVPMYDVIKQYSPELYHTLQNSDYKTTLDVLKGYEVQPSRNANDVLTDIYGYKVGYEGKLAKGDPSYQQMHYDAQPFYAELDAIDPSLSAMAHGMNATELKEYLDSLTPPKTDYTPSEAMSVASDTFLKRGDAVSRNIDTMYFDPDYGRDVKDSYTRYGTAKSGQAAAGVAADNGGNYDSFANYNRDLTDMQYRIAGDNAVQAMREGYAQGQTQFFDAWGNAVNTSNANFADYDSAVQQIGASERMASADNLVDMYGYDKTLEGQKYVSDNTLKGDIYGYDTTLEGTKHTNDTKLTAEQIAANASRDVARINANADVAAAGIKAVNGSKSGNNGTDSSGDVADDTVDMYDVMLALHAMQPDSEAGATQMLIDNGVDANTAKRYAENYFTALENGAFDENGKYFINRLADNTVLTRGNISGLKTGMAQQIVDMGGKTMTAGQLRNDLADLIDNGADEDAKTIASGYGTTLAELGLAAW